MAKGKINTVKVGKPMLTPEVSFEWFNTLEKTYKKRKYNLVMSDEAADSVYGDIVGVLKSNAPRVAKAHGVSEDMVKINNAFIQPHYKWIKGANGEKGHKEPTGNGKLMEVKINSHYPNSSDEIAPPKVFLGERDENGKLKEIDCAVGNGSKGKMQYLITVCDELIDVGDIKVVRLWAKITPQYFQVTELVEYKEASEAEKAEPLF